MSEIAWLLNLLVQTARYAEPALDELDQSLLPGVASLRPSIQHRFRSLWRDVVAGCPELLLAVPLDPDAKSMLASLSTLPKARPSAFELLSERPANRRHIRRRLERLTTDIRLRRAYRDILADVWQLARPVWERRGRIASARAAAQWQKRLGPPGAVLPQMPPRHPLAVMGRRSAAALLRRRPAYTVVPIYFCMSGGMLADVGDRLVIGVPGSAHEPIRRARDAAFVADRARTLSEPTRVQILIHLMSGPSGVMDMTRALRMSQPVVSEHVRVLVAAGLVRKDRAGYVAVPARLERHLEDARATLARWS